jgi:type VI secretion system secreted protein Hcp
LINKFEISHEEGGLMTKIELIFKRLIAVFIAGILLSLSLSMICSASLEKNNISQKEIGIPVAPTTNLSYVAPLLTGQGTIGPGGSTDRSINKAFLMIDGIAGESKEGKHLNWIELMDYSEKMESQPSTSGSGGGAAKPVHGPLAITKRMDISSPKLYLALNNGLHIKEARMELIKSGLVTMRINLSDVTITMVEVIGNDPENGQPPAETINLSYGKIKWTYFSADPRTGNIKARAESGWDLAANRPI